MTRDDLPHKCVMDTNVILTANRAQETNKTQEFSACIRACIKAIRHITTNAYLILDSNYEILKEYQKNIDLKGQPGIASGFMKWLYRNQANPDKLEYANITRKGQSYEEFPQSAHFNSFDDDDRKFVAVSNAHPEKPSILQGTDSKWWGYRDAFDKANINVVFLCETYIEAKYQKKRKP